MRCGDDKDMTWHLHYDDLIRHKIFKLLISTYLFNLIIWFGLRSLQNNIFIQNSISLHRIFITSRHHNNNNNNNNIAFFPKQVGVLQADIKYPKNYQIHMHITTQHHLSSHTINSPKTKKTSHSIICSLNSQTTLWTHNQNVYSWNFSFKSSSSLCWSSIFSQSAAEPCLSDSTSEK